MSMSDHVWEPGIERVTEGRGYSVWHEPSSQRWRADVFAGERHFSCPWMGEGEPPRKAMTDTLLWRSMGTLAYANAVALEGAWSR